jgi:hypothetical protein
VSSIKRVDVSTGLYAVAGDIFLSLAFLSNFYKSDAFCVNRSRAGDLMALCRVLLAVDSAQDVLLGH